MTERVAVFINGANLFHGLLRDYGRIEIDFEVLVLMKMDAAARRLSRKMSRYLIV